MSPRQTLKVLQRLVEDFTDGRLGFMDFQREFIEVHVRLPETGIAAVERERWAEAFRRVVTCAPEEAERLRVDLASWR